LAVYSPYLALYYRQLGFTGVQSGILLGIAPLMTLLAGPFWSGWADSKNRHHLILRITVFSAIVVMAIFPVFHSYIPVILVMAGFSFFVAPINAMLDHATITMLGSKSSNYGRIRVWGTLGWGLMAPIIGWVLKLLGLAWMFGIYCGLMLLSFPLINKLAFEKNIEIRPDFKGLGKILLTRRWIVFLLLVFVAGIGLSVQVNYLGVLINQTGGDKGLLGLALFITVFSEIPVMFFSDRLIKKYKSRGLLILAVILGGVRCFLYAITDFPQALLIIQLLHGFTFPLFWIAGVTYVAENSVAGFGATMQAVFGASLTGFGMAVGGILGGFLIDLVGLEIMFIVFGLVMFFGLGLFTLFDRGYNQSV